MKSENHIEHQTKRLVVELERMRQELDTRTQIMSKEMRSWKQQAEFATTALRDAKNEVLERKKELDTTKEKMDSIKGEQGTQESVVGGPKKRPH